MMRVAGFRDKCRGFVVSSLLISALCFAVDVQARELAWRALDVAARLDSDGRLHVTERHAMVFTGDWNGGERRFNIRPRQGLSLTGVSRDVGGSWRELTQDASMSCARAFRNWSMASLVRPCRLKKLQ